MDPTTRFFSSLRKLAVTLETETAKLQHTFDNRNDDDDSDMAARAMRAYHELNGDVRSLKGQMQEQLTQVKSHEKEVSSFIDACRVMEQKVSQNIQTLKAHWEKYGYQDPNKVENKESVKGAETAAGTENNSSHEEKTQEEAGTNHASSSSPIPGPLPFTDALRTPQLSDFGLTEIQLKRTLAGAEWCSEVPPMPEMSLPHALRTPRLSDFGLTEIQLKRTLAGAEWCSEVPPMPEMSLPHPVLDVPAPPPMAFTPKCALRMDEDELQTPQMHDFGITEHTMCLNNDFTMDLLRKNVGKPQRPSQDPPAPPLTSVMESLQTKADPLQSPEEPVFCTPGFKIQKTNGHRSPPAHAAETVESPCRPADLLSTPEVPAFQTPYMTRLVSTKKPVSMQDENGHAPDLSTPPCNGTSGTICTWEDDEPEPTVFGVEDHQMPEMPNLESCLGNSLRSGSAKIPKKRSKCDSKSGELTVDSMELDGPTQEFSLGTPLGTPCIRDVGSKLKLVSQNQSRRAATAVVYPHVRPEKEKHVPLSLVSESEFQSLPSYLKQVTLHNLNQAVCNINKYMAEHQGQVTLLMEDLRTITNVGTKAPVYILCLSELKRLEHVRGTRNNSLYKVNVQY